MRRLGSIYTLYFASGMAALGAEVVWSRMLQRILGSESWAIALVLSAFLGGMGLGALAVQSRIHRLRRPLAVFAALEFTAAVCTVGMTVLLGSGAWVLTGAGGELTAAILTALATMPLGAGFPVLLAAVTGDAHLDLRRRNTRVRCLYGVNALGGALGGAVAGLIGVALVGERSVLFGAACLQAGVAGGAVLLDRAARGLEEPASPRPAVGRPEESVRRLGSPGVLALYLFLSGFAVFFWEVLWTRILVLTVGSSTYAFAVVAASVVLGIGLGSLAFGGRFLVRHGAWVLPFATVSLTAAAYLAVPRLPDAYLAAVRGLGLSPLFCGTLGAGFVVLLPNLLLGSLFPWVVSRHPRLAGALYAVNSLGCVAGAFVGGPLTAGHWPLELTFRFGLALLLVLCATGLWSVRRAVRPERAWAWRAGFTACVLAAVTGLGSSVESALPSEVRGRLWGYKELLSGVYHWSPESLAELSLATTYTRRKLLKVVEGREVIVSVELVRQEKENGEQEIREEKTVYVLGNGRVEGSVPFDREQASRADLPTQLLLGMTPAALAPETARSPCLLIGLGSGVTLGALLDSRSSVHGRGRVDLIEIEPVYLEALRAENVAPYIEPYLEVGKLEERSDLRILFGDARRIVARDLRGERYGVIVSQPSEPWVSAAAPLFTVEFFRRASGRLEEGGLFVQWVQLYRLDPSSLRMLVRTFRRVFPRVFILRPPRSSDLILVGSRSRLRLERVLEAPPFRHREETFIAGPLGWLAVYLLGPAGVDRWVGLDPALPLNTDVRGELEFRTPQALYRGQNLARRNLEILRAFAAADPVSEYLPAELCRADFRRRLALGNLEVGDLEEAEALLEGDLSSGAEAIRARLGERRSQLGLEDPR